MKTTSETLKTLENKVALVTGSSSGIGRAAALEFARRGAKVVASARRRPEIDSLVAQIKSEGLEATAIVADVNVENDVIDLVSATIKAYGRLDIAFNNAGTEGEFTPFVEQSNQVYDTIFNANVRGVFWSMKHEAKAMLAQGSGTIINNASMGGVIGFANAALYIASKHAVLGLTKTASIEWFKQGSGSTLFVPVLLTRLSKTVSGRLKRRSTTSVPPPSRQNGHSGRNGQGCGLSRLRRFNFCFGPRPARRRRLCDCLKHFGKRAEGFAGREHAHSLSI